MKVDIVFALSLVFGLVKCEGVSLPGKPVAVSCRSPEKETFSCRWSPGADGGLPTTHRLFYTKENLEGTYECPDYRSAGEHSCFFDRNHTSVWLSYWVWVTAFNAMGNTSSDILEVDVETIVQPGPPENVSLVLGGLEATPYLHVEWRPPAKTDVSSGWVTVNYQLRVKVAGHTEEYMSGKQSNFALHSLHFGEHYEVQVRCRLDYGHWSIWSLASSISLPHYPLKQQLLWTVVSVVLITAVLCLLVMKRKTVKGWLLPPIPGPKIQGFVSQSRGSGDFLYGLIPQGFPPVLAPKGPPEEHLVVCDGQKSPVRSRILQGFYQLPRHAPEGGPAPWGGPAPEGGPAHPDGLNKAPGSVKDSCGEPWDTPGGDAAAEEEEEQQEYSRVSRVRENVVVLERDPPPLDPPPRPPGTPSRSPAWGSWTADTWTPRGPDRTLSVVQLLNLMLPVSCVLVSANQRRGDRGEPQELPPVRSSDRSCRRV